MKNIMDIVKDSLYDNHPILVREWDYKKNIGLTPHMVTSGSNRKVWWTCANGHSYECSIEHRTYRNQGCPYCSGKRILPGYNDLKTRSPQLAEEWNYEKNGLDKPDHIALNSHKKYWWKCKKCSYEWEATPNDRARGRACPICAKQNRSKTRNQTLLNNRADNTLSNNEKLLSEWDYQKNGINPDEVFVGSSKKFWWICQVCGNTWQASISNRVKGSGCPKCMKHMRTSFPEQAIYYYLKKEFPIVNNGYTEVFDNKMELDIYIPSIKTGIEYDGIAFHSGSKAEREMITKYRICSANQIKLVRVSEFENKSASYDKCIIRNGHTDKDLESTIIQLLDFLEVRDISVDISRDRSVIMQQYITTIRAKSISNRYPEIAKKWDVEKNGGIRADQVNAFSNIKFWWRCSLGHSYKSTPVCEITDTKTCPICSNHRVLAGFNDLEFKAPDIAREWDYQSNEPVLPSAVIFTTQKKYWWLCPKGHRYLSSVSNRYYAKTGCPYCSNSKALKGYNDLATKNPELVKEWDYARNHDLKPEQFVPGSNKKVWWVCSLGHEWEASINSRSGKYHTRCPFCSNHKVLTGFNDLATTNPEFLGEWDYDKNGNVEPSSIIAGSNKKVWWKCRTCGYEWNCTVVSRTYGQKTGCPKCGYKIRMQKTRKERIVREKKDLYSLFPDIAKEWDYEKNLEKPDEISYGANKKIWWKCSNGHSYQAWLSDRTGKRKTGCPYCHGKRKIIGEETDIE